MISGMSAIRPYKCTGRIARVLSVIAAATLVGQRLNVFISGSTKTGCNRFSVIASMLAMYVLAGAMTSSPSFSFPSSFQARKVRVSASKPLATPMQCLTPQYVANDSSNA